MKQYTKTINGRVEIKPASRIVVKRNGMQIINPSEELLFSDGWVEYVPPVVEPQPYQPSERELLQELMKEDFNARTTTSNEDALHYMLIVYPFEHYIGKALKTGQLVTHLDRIYRVRQDILVVLEDQEPSVDTAALYEVIEKEHSGEADDPIPYTPPMEIYEGKYYTQFDVLYKCTRDSGTALTHDLFDLRGMYVELIEQ